MSNTGLWCSQRYIYSWIKIWIKAIWVKPRINRCIAFLRLVPGIGPLLTSQPEGTSTDRIGTDVFDNSSIRGPNGSLIPPVGSKLNPKIESIIWLYWLYKNDHTLARLSYYSSCLRYFKFVNTGWPLKAWDLLYFQRLQPRIAEQLQKDFRKEVFSVALGKKCGLHGQSESDALSKIKVK